MARAVGDLKECCRCKQIKSTTDFPKMKKALDGLNHYCRTCAHLEYEKNKEKRHAQYKKYYDTHREQCIAKVRRYEHEKFGMPLLDKWKRFLPKPKQFPSHEEVIARERERGRKYKLEHREEMRAKFKEYYYRDINKSRKQTKIRVNKYKCNHPEVYEYHREAARNWYHNNKELSRYNTNQWRKTPTGKLCVLRDNERRRLGNKDLNNTLSIKDIEYLLVFQNNECANCGREFSEYLKFTVDHIIPLSKGGSLVKENVQLLCRSCNSSKNNKTIRYIPNANFVSLSFI